MDDQLCDDATVIAASVANSELFAVIFDRHSAYLHRYLARRLGPDAADDLVGELFLVAFRRRDRYDTTRPDARPWLYGIAAHLVAGHRRTQAQRWRLLAKVPPGPDEPDPAEEIEARAGAQASRAALATALAHLSRHEREVLLLVAWEQLSYEQIADALDIPVGTVRSRLHRTRTKLRTRLVGLDPRAGTEPTIKELLTNE